jgi:hypothetical protein
MKIFQKNRDYSFPSSPYRCFIFNALIIGVAVLLTGCGSLTGLPGHGGGKRFAIEQELVAASTRGALKQIDLSVLKGKKVNLFVNAIGDTGAGNLSGGRLSVVSQLRGDYVQTPPTTEKSVFPSYKTTTNSNSSTNTSSDSSTSGDSGSTSTTGTTTTTSSGTNGSTTNGSSSSTTTSSSVSDSVLPYPESKTTQQKGAGGVAQIGTEYKGLGEYHNSETLFGSSDLQYFSALLNTYLFLKGVHVVPPSEAEIDIYVTVDVFGTVRSRVEWFLANNEILQARTSLEIMAIDHVSGQLIVRPQAVGAEAEYNEQYLVWIGPISARKFMKKADPLLCDFTDLPDDKVIETKPVDQGEPIPYPFRHTVERLMQED